MAAAAAAAPPPPTPLRPTSPPPYSVRLSPETARNLSVNGATILLLDVPLGTPIGLDQQVFLSGPSFKGIKMLPPGVHFLSYQALSKDGRTLSPPVGTFLWLKPRQVYVRRWNPAGEGLVALADDEEESRYAAGVANFDFDRQLAPYDLGRYSQWVSLSCHITEQVLSALLPADGEISIMAEAVAPELMTPHSKAEWRLQQQLEEGRARVQAAMQIDATDNLSIECQQQQQQSAGGQQQQQQQQQQQVPSDASNKPKGGRCHYTHLPRVLKVPGASGTQLTQLNVDKTALLEQVMQRYGTYFSSGSSSSSSETHQAGGSMANADLAVLGEFQFAFIAFICGQSLEGYMHWKKLLVLLLGCTVAPLETHTQLFVAFLEAVSAQLQLGLAVTPASDGSTQQQQQQQESSIPESHLPSAASLFGGDLVDELLPDSFLKGAFRGFIDMLQEEGAHAPAALLAQARVLERVLAVGLGWDFRLHQLKAGSDDDESDAEDDGPVVVELTEQQLAELEANSSRLL